MFRAIQHALAAVFGNCRDFCREWDRAPLPSAGQVAGKWRGKWVSELNEHSGELRAVIHEPGADSIRIFFFARYGRIFRICYSTELKCIANGRGGFDLRGEADLGKLAGGVYEYKGTVIPDGFESTYRCSYDFGRFEMRPARDSTA